ncbi:hypothetical protein OAN307_c19210 [Octadecabacter antarcticus 307]|uniref:Uncharacterized protein n=1 Tax=Octadecabacter antarcticus 307 TaxID=391626 RepID=M9RCN2_9RHOB|nr:hypothetical protein OAN307_c19210 [Octadecabacter antarcticus 307]
MVGLSRKCKSEAENGPKRSSTHFSHTAKQLPKSRHGRLCLICGSASQQSQNFSLGLVDLIVPLRLIVQVEITNGRPCTLAKREF